ncbi:hypothetical protein GCM10022254_26910 [Actinomadura meridiana]|uniref:Uncharacterized protein n=1 Tax=Actinomadura meridiana TaxID=559626 RepID=A0ABP8BZG1_9ACTN
MSQPPGSPYAPPPTAVPPPPPGRNGKPLAIAVAAAVAVIALIVAVAVVALLVLPDDDSSEPLSSGPVDLRQPLTFTLVAQQSAPPCTGGALPDPAKSACYVFGTDALTVRRLERVEAMRPDPARGRTAWGVALTLTSTDATGFATLTGKAAEASRGGLPAKTMGMLVGGALVSEPAQVAEAISGGQVEINGPPTTFTQSYVEGIVRRLIGE